MLTPKRAAAALFVLLTAFLGALLLRRALYTPEVKISFIGDILLSRGVAEYIQEYGYDYPYQYVRDIFHDDDLTVGNLECPITESEGSVNKPPVIIFKASPENGAALKEAGIDCLNLANNHTMDYGSKGLEDTIDILAVNGLGYVGAGKTKEEIAPYLFQKNGIKIGILSYSALPAEGFFYNNQKPTVQYISPQNISEMEADITSLECDFTIVFFHWGTEFADYVTESQEQLARAAIDVGADLVIGAHPHVLQKVEMYNGKYIFYSLGNFIFDRQIQKGTDETIILQATFKKGGSLWFEVIPVYINDCMPQPPNETQKERILGGLGISPF